MCDYLNSCADREFSSLIVVSFSFQHRFALLHRPPLSKSDVRFFFLSLFPIGSEIPESHDF